ncbi:MAG: ComEC/Rec2 family competence protein [Petrimonas mucosa]|jgi:beta-lactamase superfamily II metal-dependent hydrolase|uniref:ComEC/Rec2 family competence protein n=1 Tax=Petrimonas mucosa TaxID=1642646 RepID=UPI003D8B0F99
MMNFFYKQVSILLFISAFFMSCISSSHEIGKPYRGWKEGEFDIHHIYTGRGESNFLIFPDGTSMLIDAGDWDPKDYDKMCELLPDSSRRSGEWIARYILRVNPSGKEVDYLLISHFHNDHTGDSFNPAPTTEGRNPDYVLTGIAEVGEYIRFKKVIDRGFPDYQYPLPIEDPDVDNYRAFINWKIRNEGLIPESFDIGSSSQITLLKEKERYSGLFQVQNLAANGRIWTGNGGETINFYDLNPANREGWQNENSKSIGIKINYGPFSYFTAGDLSDNLLDEEGNSINLENEIAKVCGPVVVCKANHHAYKDAMTEGFLKQIDASAYIIPVWDHEHIQPVIMERMASYSPHSENPTIYPTRFPDHLREKYGNEAWIDSVCQEGGHIVVKAYDKGTKYKIYVLSAKDEQSIVRAVYGPFS